MDAIAALEDPHRLEDFDDRHACGEKRAMTIGMAMSRALFVVTTARGADMCRIISVRRATRHEEDWDYKSDREAW